jgi:hypothetical protein
MTRPTTAFPSPRRCRRFRPAGVPLAAVAGSSRPAPAHAQPGPVRKPRLTCGEAA